MVKFHQHALERMIERGATESEISATIDHGESFPTKYGRTGFRRNFRFENFWRGKYYATKQIEAFAVKKDKDWLIITVMVRYF